MSIPNIEQPLIINMCPTGIISTKDQNINIPISRSEIVDTVLEASELGVQMVHLHARDDTGQATSDAEKYAAIFSEIRRDTKGKDLVICVTTSGRKIPDVSARTAVLNLDGVAKPDMASLTLSSLNFMTQASVNSPDTIRELAQRMKNRGIKPELEVFDLGMVNFAKVLIREGLIEAPYYFNILLGNIGTAQATLSHLAVLVNDLPQGAIWSVAGIGRFQKTMSTIGVAMANGVRVGLEDNLWTSFNPTKTPATNIELVQGVLDMAATVERPLMGVQKVRILLGLN